MQMWSYLGYKTGTKEIEEKSLIDEIEFPTVEQWINEQYKELSSEILKELDQLFIKIKQELVEKIAKGYSSLTYTQNMDNNIRYIKLHILAQKFVNCMKKEMADKGFTAIGQANIVESSLVISFSWFELQNETNKKPSDYIPSAAEWKIIQEKVKKEKETQLKLNMENEKIRIQQLFRNDIIKFVNNGMTNYYGTYGMAYDQLYKTHPDTVVKEFSPSFNSILKELIEKGYEINQKEITFERFNHNLCVKFELSSLTNQDNIVIEI